MVPGTLEDPLVDRFCGNHAQGHAVAGYQQARALAFTQHDQGIDDAAVLINQCHGTRHVFGCLLYTSDAADEL